MTTPITPSTAKKNPVVSVRLSGVAFVQLAFLNSGRVEITKKLGVILAKMKEGFIRRRIE